MKKKHITILILLIAIIIISSIQITSCSKKVDKDSNSTSKSETTTQTAKSKEAEEKAKAEAEAKAKSEAKKTVAEKQGVDSLSKTMYVKNATNVRSDATSDSTKLGGYNKGTSVKVTGKVGNGWYRIDCSSKVGYIEGSYLTDTKPVVQKATPKATTSKKSSTTSTPKKSSSSNTSSGGTAKSPAPKPAPEPQPSSSGGMQYMGAPDGSGTNFNFD